MTTTTTPALPPAARIDHLATVWSIVEARPTVPSLIVVASATELDNTEPVARGLARAALEAGKRIGYLYLGVGRPTPRDTNFAYPELTISTRHSPRESFDASIDSWRSAYDVIIVELPQLSSCPLGAHVARLAEGIVISLCPDRKVLPADRELKGLLDQLGATIIGVVKTAPIQPQKSTALALSGSLTSRFFPVRQP